MYGQNDLSKIKSSLTDNVGHKVRLTAKKGRKQIVTREGVIESTYPSIFTVKLDNQSEFFTSEQRVSYSYTDVLTKSVELVIYTPQDGTDSVFFSRADDEGVMTDVADMEEIV